ncbi:unnamed protein product [Blepharisma stoltei]|uniref:Uncharacterized protein n=1 Tax=Blepharisma stoltei TaxID=1481888 RepID=A0AAU9JRV5_9CILI|nr:unnamed protein product [Blepharisma stoltei]
MDQNLENLWRDFGRESEAGKLLFQLYRIPNKPNIYYPPVKTAKKPLPCEISKSKTKEKPQIEYPEMNKPQSRPKIHPIDLIPKRKSKDVIKEEINQNYRGLQAPPKKGANREVLKSELQEKFQFSNGALPKSVMMPPGGSRPANRNVARAPKKAEEPVTNNLEELFDMIVKEIEERQKFLDDMRTINQLPPEVENRVKGEIASRISELQKIREMSG